jgi:hypothetical protein
VPIYVACTPLCNPVNSNRMYLHEMLRSIRLRGEVCGTAADERKMTVSLWRWKSTL